MSARKQHDASKRSSAEKLHAEGWGPTQICLHLDVNYATLRSWIFDLECELCLGPVEKGEWKRCRRCRLSYGIAQHQPGEKLYGR